jgi:mRNA-degrading endonuclease toxin of MazEF toxin-antitoxin module
MIVRAAAVVIVAACGRVERAATPCIAITPKVIHAAAGVAFRAGIVVITHGRRLHRGWRRRTGVWGVGTLL